MAVYGAAGSLNSGRRSYGDFKCVKVSDNEMRCSAIRRDGDDSLFPLFIFCVIIFLPATIGYQLRKRVFKQKSMFEGRDEFEWAVLASFFTIAFMSLLCFVGIS